MEQLMEKERLVCVAKCVAPHGLRGQVKLQSYVAYIDDLKMYSPLMDEVGHVYEIDGIKEGAKGLWLVSFSSVRKREQAEKMRGVKLFVRRDVLIEDEDDSSFMICDLEGVQVRCHASGHELGYVKGVHNFGAGDVIEVQPLQGKSQFYSFSEENFPTIMLDEDYVTFVEPDILIVSEEAAKKEEE